MNRSYHEHARYSGFPLGASMHVYVGSYRKYTIFALFFTYQVNVESLEPASAPLRILILIAPRLRAFFYFRASHIYHEEDLIFIHVATQMTLSLDGLVTIVPPQEQHAK